MYVVVLNYDFFSDEREQALAYSDISWFVAGTVGPILFVKPAHSNVLNTDRIQDRWLSLKTRRAISTNIWFQQLSQGISLLPALRHLLSIFT